jgi:aminopeptidase N
MALQALRHTVGSSTFFTIVRTYLAIFQHRCSMTADFVGVAEAVGGQQLDRPFHVWLYARHRPRPSIRNGFPAHWPNPAP